MSEELKFCKDCKHGVVGHFSSGRISGVVCHHENNMQYNVVTGEKKCKQCCEGLRELIWDDGEYCGKDGKWFEEK